MGILDRNNRKEYILYSVGLPSELPHMLNGQYEDGISWNSGTRLIQLARAGGPVSACPAVQTGQAYVLVYRSGRFRGRPIKPSLHCDDRDAALVYPGYCFPTAPKSYLSSGDRYTTVKLEAETGKTCYVKVSPGKTETFRAGVEVGQVDAAAATNDLRKVKAAKAEYINRKDIVATALPGR